MVQARSSIACPAAPLTARLPARPHVRPISTPSTPRPRIADFKPLLTELFDDEAENQSAQQLQQKIDQLQKLQHILQMQQEGLKQQQVQLVAQSYQPTREPARGYSASTASPRGRNWAGLCWHRWFYDVLFYFMLQFMYSKFTA